MQSEFHQLWANAIGPARPGPRYRFLRKFFCNPKRFRRKRSSPGNPGSPRRPRHVTTPVGPRGRVVPGFVDYRARPNAQLIDDYWYWYWRWQFDPGIWKKKRSWNGRLKLGKFMDDNDSSGCGKSAIAPCKRPWQVMRIVTRQEKGKAKGADAPGRPPNQCRHELSAGLPLRFSNPRVSHERRPTTGCCRHAASSAHGLRLPRLRRRVSWHRTGSPCRH